jgi:3-hydroxybutyryl-CoA dehydrogenase
MQASSQLAGLREDIKTTSRVVGVVGAGVMGAGVAQVLASTGHDVVLVDLTGQILESARRRIAHSLRFGKLFVPADAAIPAGDVLSRISLTTEYGLLRDAHFIIENATEDWNIKKEIYRTLDTTCSADCVFAANTSAISITQIGSATARPDRVLGIHFMNPVPLKPMVELIRGFHTSEHSLQTAMSVLKDMKKEWVLVNDSPGFVSNRVLMVTINEAIYLLQEQVASAQQVDAIFRGCFSHKMGPLETADLIGLDTILYSIQVLYNSFQDSKFRPCPLLKKMVDAGLHGRKSGRGFYDYSTEAVP